MSFLLISFFKASSVSFLNSLGTISQIFGARKEILSVPQKSTSYIWLIVNRNHYFLVEIIVSQ